jgi:putative glutathione S-transferase
VPQGQIVGAVSECWKFAWKRMMAELASQGETGTYIQPGYTFDGKIGPPTFPDEAGQYHLYTGNPCPWCHRVVQTVKILGLSTTIGAGPDGRKSPPPLIGLTVLEDNP